MATPQQTGIFFTGAMPEGALKQFPVEFNGNFIKQLDYGFLMILAACAVVLGSTFFILSLRPLAETISEKEILKIQERYAQLVLEQSKKEVKEAVKKAKAPAEDVSKGEVKEEKEDKVKIDRKKESVVEKKQRKEATSEDRRRKRDAIKQQVQSAGLFAAITSSGSGVGGVSSGVTDLLGSSEGMGDLGDIDISEGSFATKIVDLATLKKRRGEKTSGVGIKKQAVGTAAGTQIASTGKVKITSAPPKIKGESAGKGSRSQAAINRVVIRQQSRLKKVYESMLKRDPALAGKLMVKFTIMPDGTVANVSIVNSTTNNATFDRRILSYIKRWKFLPIPGGGPVEVIFPFVFSGST